MGKGFWTSPSFLWKEVPRRGGGWLPQRDETKSETAHPPVSSSRAQPSIFLAGWKTVHMRKSVIPSPMKYGVYRSPHIFCLTGVQGRFLDFARNDDTGKALLSFSACLRRISPLSFIPPVPYPPLRRTFPSRGRLFMTNGEAPPSFLIRENFHRKPWTTTPMVSYGFFSQYATCVSAAPMPRAVLMPMPVYMAKEARVAARLAAMSFLKKP